MHVVATCVSLGGTRGASIHRMPITAVVASSDASGGRSTVSRQPRLQHALDNEKPAPAMSYLLQRTTMGSYEPPAAMRQPLTVRAGGADPA
jgi:hypothetical protein